MAISEVKKECIVEHYKGKEFCFVAVIPKTGSAMFSGGLGVAVANETGYFPIVGSETKTHDEAVVEARKLNEEIGLDLDTACRIEASSMFGVYFAGNLK